MKKNYNTYKKSGVNMAVADNLVNYISKISRKTHKKNHESKSFKNIGSFGSIFDLSKLKMKNPVIVSSTFGYLAQIPRVTTRRLLNFKRLFHIQTVQALTPPRPLPRPQGWAGGRNRELLNQCHSLQPLQVCPFRHAPKPQN